MKNYFLILLASLFLLLGACATTPPPEEEVATEPAETEQAATEEAAEEAADEAVAEAAEEVVAEEQATEQAVAETAEQAAFAVDETQVLIDEALEIINRDGVVYFDFDDFSLRPDSLSTLDDVVPVLLQVLELSPGSEIFVGGHTDERGTPEYNLGLGARRSEAVGRYLRTNGISAESINTTSFGESEPIDPGHNEEAWSLNRRAEISVIIN